jgi:DNA-binding response OmpR family regulator
MTKKVLIADDEPNILITLEYLMKREGWIVSVARDGNEALEAIRRERPDLVLLDVMMPGKTGYEVCAALRADESLAATQVLMLTAKGRDTDRAQGLGVGADADKTKTFSTQELAAQVRRMLGKE